jgi:glucokinase
LRHDTFGRFKRKIQLNATFKMNTNSETEHRVLGIDIGGSHITAGLVNITEKKIIATSVVRSKVNRHAPASEILGIWAEVINTMYDQRNGSFSEVGFAMPGPFDYENGICLIKEVDKYEALYGMNIRREIAARTNIEKENIIFRNDADAFLEGEVFCGAAQGFHRAMGITLGTGLGSCFYDNGAISNASLYDMNFKEGVAEDYISTRWFEKTYLNYTGKQINGVKPVADAYGEEEAARLIFNEFAENLSLLLSHCIDVYRPDIFVIGGNIANAFNIFIGHVYQLLSEQGRTPLIRTAHLGEEAALIGAASNFEKRFALQEK